MKKLAILFLTFLWAGVLFPSEASRTFHLNIFFTNDLHGGIVEQSADFLNPEFPPMLGGGASAYAIMEEARKKIGKQGDEWLLIDAGDIFQGTLVGTQSQGKVIIDYMNKAGYHALTPGNHDFDLGKDNLKQLIERSDFPWVNCNILNKETGKLWEPLKPYIIREIKGLKVGITGATTVGTEEMSFSENIKGLDFIPEIPALQKTVNALRNEEKVDLVVALVHAGLPYDTRQGYRQLQKTTYQEVLKRGYANAMEMAHFVKGIDILLGGHLHRGYQKPWVDPVNHTICIQNYGNGGNLGWLKVKIDRPSGTILGYDYPAEEGSLLLLTEDEFWPDSSMRSFIQSKQEVYAAGFHDVIGITKTALTRSGIHEAPMYNLVTDAMRRRTDADFAFTNYGGVRADIKVGPITKADIFAVLPFGNQLVKFQVDGAFLKKIVEEKIKGGRSGMAVSGGKIVYNKNRPDQDRIVQFLINGKPLDADKNYWVATTDYLIEGNSGMDILTTIPQERIAYTGILMRDAVIEYVKENSPLHIKVEGRWDKDNDAQPDPKWINQFREEQAVMQQPE